MLVSVYTQRDRQTDRQMAMCTHALLPKIKPNPTLLYKATLPTFMRPFLGSTIAQLQDATLHQITLHYTTNRLDYTTPLHYYTTRLHWTRYWRFVDLCLRMTVHVHLHGSGTLLLE